MTIDVLYEHFAPKHIRWPTEEEARAEAKAFSDAYGMPEIIFACVDGTPINVSQF